MKNNRCITSVDVARIAGVSQATVSRAFNSPKSLKDETRKKILKVAKELGYKPNAIARILNSNKSNLIGVVMGRIGSPFYSTILAKLSEKLMEKNKNMLLFDVCSVDDIKSVITNNILEYRVEGILVFDTYLTLEVSEECKKYNTPVVSINKYVPGTNVSSVCCDNMEAGIKVANYLFDLGCRDIIYLGGDQRTYTNMERERGFTNRLKELGIKNYKIYNGNYNYECGKKLGRSILQEYTPDAVFAASDLMALGFMDVAKYEKGLNIPKDIKLVGFDDIPMSSWDPYLITTVKQPIERMIDSAVELLLDEHRIDQAILKLYECELVVRNSTKL